MSLAFLTDSVKPLELTDLMFWRTTLKSILNQFLVTPGVQPEDTDPITFRIAEIDAEIASRMRARLEKRLTRAKIERDALLPDNVKLSQKEAAVTQLQRELESLK